MYSEIKDNQRILINRLTDNERILLKNIYEVSKNADISFKELDGETGDFDGLMLNIIPKEPEEIKLTDFIAQSLEVYQKEEYTYEFPVESDVSILTRCNDPEKLLIYTVGNKLTILASEPLEDTIQYEIGKEGAKHIHGEIKLNAIVRDTAKVTFNIIPEDTYTIRVCDENCTCYKEENGVYNLPIGKYHVFVNPLSHEYEKVEFEVTEEDILNINKTVEIDLIATNETCRVVFKLSPKECFGRVRMLVVDNSTEKEFESVSFDEMFGIEVFHLPVGSYTYSIVSEKDEWYMEKTELVITEDDIRIEKDISVLANKVEEEKPPVEPETLNKVELDKAKDLAASKEESDYTEDSYKTLQDALELPETTQEEVDAKTAAINSAIENLVKRPPALGGNQIYGTITIKTLANNISEDEILEAIESIQIYNSDSVVADWEQPYLITKNNTTPSSVTYNFVVTKNSQYKVKISIKDSDEYTYTLDDGNKTEFYTVVDSTSFNMTRIISKQSK